MEQNKTIKYFKYAIGEIVLVVIGILIALQINNWNTKRIDHQLGLQFLKEIKYNLKDDLESLHSTLRFNKIKDSCITETFKIMASNEPKQVRVQELTKFLPTLTSYEVFIANQVAFDNMTSSFNINVISNDSLRKELSNYYKHTSNLSNFTQEQVKQQTRRFIDESLTALIDKNTVKEYVGLDVDIHQTEDFFTEPLTFKNLFNMRMNMKAQNELLKSMETQINSILMGINKTIENY